MIEKILRTLFLAGVAIAVGFMIGLAIMLPSTAQAGEFDQITYCQWASLITCKDEGEACVGGDTPAQVEAKLQRKPSAVLTIPPDLGITGEKFIYLANSGRVVALDFGDGHLFSGSNDYFAFLDSHAQCAKKVDV